MAKITKKILLIGVIAIMGLGLFGCSGGTRITDFEGLSDLPRNPRKIVFTTNSPSQGEDVRVDIVVDVPQGSVDFVMETLFNRRYERLSRNISIDLLDIERFLRIYDEAGNYWRVCVAHPLRHNNRWYVQQGSDNLVKYLYDLIV